jgi:PHD/YefM family antitoxin component YafN of YafNO toxin-antitoxin module
MREGLSAMNFSRIKSLVRQNGEKIIFLENGEPEVVMMSFEEYEKLLVRMRPDFPEKNDSRKTKEAIPYPRASRTNFENDGYRETELVFTPNPEQADIPDVRPENIRVEDLPL